MTNETWRADERYELTDDDGNTTVYEFMLSDRGAMGGNSISPFPPKTVVGERSLSDYDTESAIALSDLSGGIGQERLVDPKMYRVGQDIDTRGGKVIIGPKVHSTALAPLNSNWTGALTGSADTVWGSDGLWVDIDASVTGYQNYAAAITSSESGYIDRVWLPLAITGEAEDIVVTIRTDAPDGAIADTLLWDRTDARPDGTWMEFKTSTAIAVADADYVVVQHRGTAADSVRWLAINNSGSSSNAMRTTTSWNYMVEGYWTNNPVLSTLAQQMQVTDLGTQYTRIYLDPQYIAPAHQVGIVACMDRPLTPQDGIRVTLDNGWMELEKLVAGTWSIISATTITYVDGAALYLQTYPYDDKFYVSVVYGNIQLYNDWIDDASIISNTFHGIYSDYIDNRIASLNMYKRVTSEIDSYAWTKVTDPLWLDNVWENEEAGINLIYSANPGRITPDGPLHLIPGVGADDIPRMWGYSGNYLFYIDNTGTPVAARDASGVKRLDGEILDAVWFRPAGESNSWLYLALGETHGMVRFNGNVGAEDWDDPLMIVVDDVETVDEVCASRLCVHDPMLWRIDNRNEISGSIDGTTWGTATSVGDATYEVERLLSWNNAVWAGKADGVYKITYADIYPGSIDEPWAVLGLDLRPIANGNNCRMMTVHQGDLYFSLIDGVGKWTASGVFLPQAPDIGVENVLSVRGRYESAGTSVTSLWVGKSGDINEPSSLMAYYDGAWTNIASTTYFGERIMSVAVDPGWYGTLPRIWFSTPHYLYYVNMPLTTLKRWLWDNADYASSGFFETSWIDGNLITVDKHWSYIEVMTEGSDADAATQGSFDFYYRTTPDGTWYNFQTLYAGEDGTTILRFLPEFVHAERIQIKVKINAHLDADGITIGSPRLTALILRYVERPDDARGFTTTYVFSSRGVWRTGAPVNLSVKEQLDQLQTLRSARVPIKWYPAWAAGASYNCYIVGYDGTFVINDSNDALDRYEMHVAVKLQLAYNKQRQNSTIIAV